MASETGKRGMQGWDDRRQLLAFVLISAAFVVVGILMGVFDMADYGGRSSGAPSVQATMAVPTP